MSEVQAKKELETTVDTNARAISDLKTEVEKAIKTVESNLIQEHTENVENFSNLNKVQKDVGSRLETLEKAGPDSMKDLSEKLQVGLQDLDKNLNIKLKESEEKIEKNCHSIASHANMLSEHTENIMLSLQPMPVSTISLS